MIWGYPNSRKPPCSIFLASCQSLPSHEAERSAAWHKPCPRHRSPPTHRPTPELANWVLHPMDLGISWHFFTRLVVDGKQIYRKHQETMVFLAKYGLFLHQHFPSTNSWIRQDMVATLADEVALTIPIMSFDLALKWLSELTQNQYLLENCRFWDRQKQKLSETMPPCDTYERLKPVSTAITVSELQSDSTHNPFFYNNVHLHLKTAGLCLSSTR